MDLKHFDEEKASADELWEWYLLEYKNQHFIVKHLLNNFFKKIQTIVAKFDTNDKLLEVGCGAGASSLRIGEMLAGQSFEVSEFDARLVGKLKETGFPLPVRKESVLNLERPDRSFDCIFLLEVLEHVVDYERALSELFRVSRKYVVISVPNEPWWRIMNIARGKYLSQLGNTPGHINHWGMLSLRRLICRYAKTVHIFAPPPWILALAEVDK